MTYIGITLLALLSIFAFFKIGKRFFARLDLKDWVLFLFILAFTFGAIIPSISIAATVSFAIGGFLVPLLFSLVLLFASNAKKHLFKLSITFILVATLSLATRMLLLQFVGGLWSAVLLGVIAGLTANLIGKSHHTIILGAILGVMLGDVVATVIAHIVQNTPLNFGANGTFDSIIISVFLGIAILEAMRWIKKRRQAKSTPIGELRFELGDDIDLKKIKSPEDEIFKMIDGD